MDDADLHRIADRLFDAFVAHDLDTVEAMLAPGAAVTQNGNRMTFSVARTMIEALRPVIGDHRYENVRRVVGDHAIVEEHAVVSTTPAGRAIDLDACVVIRVDDEGMITSVDEYVDTAGLR